MHTAFISGFSSELEKVAFGPNLCGGGRDVPWSDRFQGTPLHEQALALEAQEAEQMLQLEEQRVAERQAEEQKPKMWEIESRVRDQFNLARKRLEVQLLKAQQAQQAQDKQDGWEDLDATRQQAQPAPVPQAQPQQVSPQQGAAPQQSAPGR